MTTTTSYGAQQRANILEFIYGEERAKYECLKTLVKAFGENNIRWGLSCSAGLYFHGIVDHFTDYDIVVHKKDIDKALQILRGIMEEEEAYSKPCFQSDYYGEFIFKISERDAVEIDLICVFGVNTFGAHYVYDFDAEYVEYVEIEEGFNVPLIPEEAQWLLYSMMIGWQPQRRFKRDLITQYLQTVGIAHPQVFDESLDSRLNQLPYWMKDEIRYLCGKK